MVLILINTFNPTSFQQKALLHAANFNRNNTEVNGVITLHKDLLILFEHSKQVNEKIELQDDGNTILISADADYYAVGVPRLLYLKNAIAP